MYRVIEALQKTHRWVLVDPKDEQALKKVFKFRDFEHRLNLSTNLPEIPVGKLSSTITETSSTIQLEISNPPNLEQNKMFFLSAIESDFVGRKLLNTLQQIDTHGGTSKNFLENPIEWGTKQPKDHDDLSKYVPIVLAICTTPNIFRESSDNVVNWV